MSTPRRIVVGVTGASGALYGLRTLELLREVENVETHLVVSKGARATIRSELSITSTELAAQADVCHSDSNLGASIASGSFHADGMLIAPCSVKTMSGIANSYADNLIVRAADVMLKERRRLVLLLRETPLHLGHLRLMTQVTEAGGIVMPPVPALYAHPRSIQDLVDFTVVRALDLIGVHGPAITRWSGIENDEPVMLTREGKRA
ncbi:UbiX family flavin prenyltransferase [Mycobacterium sp. NAZ190054]|uniref:UbiX family flavin prenyltransferase n=1 Tax=Mycobacterium sp. NAZ190054 TaxID=1747766 RepID=UPI0007992C7F|nr:UbiX family flavin prenyltransferase [Mycobacterium sp. NAZ190054]KWX66209.1 3-octaprenyl-4-hydroxybenzoate carboxy-lyase [Mycobacterium sp. NAZ190054]